MQSLFPFMTQEDPPNPKKINRYKSRDNYVTAMSRGGKNTEGAAERLISYRVSFPFIGPEQLLGVYPSAFVIPSHQFPDGRVRPQWNVAFVHVKTVKPVNPDNPYYDRPRHRLLAMWQGRDTTFTREQALDQFPHIVGGLSWVGNDIDMAWVDKEYRGKHPEANVPSLYAALRKFATQLGAVGLKPGDDLTSKSFRAAQAKHDWNRTKNQEIPKPSSPPLDGEGLEKADL